MLAGPYCGMILADLGAEVIKIEPPGGDIARHIGPHSVGPHNIYFASLNRNKRSVTLDLATAGGKVELAKLVSGSKALITNLRPRSIKRLGLTYERLRVFNEQLVCLALTGFGLEGPFSDRPAYDYVIQALTGVMALTGDPGTPPTKTGYSVVDNSAGLMGSVAVLAKLVEGKGGQLDVSLYDVMLSQLNYIAAAYLNAEERPARQKDGAHPYIIPAQVFRARDGYLALFITRDELWRRFAQVIGRPEWADDADFATMSARAVNRDKVIPAIAEILATDTAASWVGRLAPHGIVVAGVETLDSALESELVRDRHMIATVPTPDGVLRLVANPVRVGGYDVAEYRAPPLLGEGNLDLIGRAPT